MASLYDDDEHAEALLEAAQAAEEREQHRTLLGYSDMLDALYNIADRLGALYSVTIAVNSDNGKAPDVPPMPRPETAVDRAKNKKFLQRHKSRVAQMLGSGADG